MINIKKNRLTKYVLFFSVFFLIISSINMFSAFTTTTPSIMINQDDFQNAGVFVDGQEENEIIFIYQSGEKGHAGGDKQIVYSRSHDNGVTWSNYNIIFDNWSYLGGGNVANDYVVVFVRAAIDTSNPLYYFLSNDNCTTWSGPTLLSKGSYNADILPFNSIMTISDNPNSSRIYWQLFYSSDGLVAYYSADGTVWSVSNSTLITSSTTGVEPCGTYVGNGKVIVLCRHSDGATNAIQINSTDYGVTWGSYQSTNICPSNFVVSPYITKINDTYVLVSATTRETGDVSGRNRLFLYLGEIDTVFYNPLGYVNKTEIVHSTSDTKFYGYSRGGQINFSSWIISYVNSSGGYAADQFAWIERFYVTFDWENIHFNSIDNVTNQSTVYETFVLFNWSLVNGAVCYQLQISDDAAFNNILVNLTDINQYTYPSYYKETTDSVEFTLPVIYRIGSYGEYYFRVRSYV